MTGALEHIAHGRGVLTSLRHESADLCADPQLSALLALLWHADRQIRHEAATALAGGDYHRPYTPAHSHFATLFLRCLTRCAPKAPPTTETMYGAAVTSLRTALDRNTADMRAMTNMSYSFLSNSLYAALFATGHDLLAAVERLRAAGAHPAICRMMWRLDGMSVTRKLNAQDVERMACAGAATLAALPPHELTDLWSSLQHRSLARRRAVAPVLDKLADARAGPLLARALAEQPSDIAERVIGALARVGDAESLPALSRAARHPRLSVRRRARAAIHSIQRRARWSRTADLLRAFHQRSAELPQEMVRPAKFRAPDAQFVISSAHPPRST